MFRRLQSCNNLEDMRLLAKQRLPGPIFHLSLPKNLSV